MYNFQIDVCKDIVFRGVDAAASYLSFIARVHGCKVEGGGDER